MNQTLEQELKLHQQEMLKQQQRTKKINQQCFALVLGLFVVLLVPTFLFSTPKETLLGLYNIMTSPSNLTTDYFVIGGVGGAFANSALILLLYILLVRRLKMDFTGPIVASLFLVAGFAFFGKNLYNSIPITLGVYLNSWLTKQPFEKNFLPGLFGTSLGPIVSIITFGIGLPVPIGALLGCLLGVFIGFILPPLSTNTLRFHAGYNLYNVGFTAGLIGMFVIGLMRMLGYQIETVSILFEDPTPVLNTVVIGAWIIFIILGLILLYRSNHSLKQYHELTKNSGRLVADFINIYGFEVVLLNMGIMGLIATLYVILINGHLTGPTMGGILTVVGFSAFGKHIKNAPPVMLGVFLASLLTGGGPSTNTALLGTLFGTALSPITGHYGFFAGCLVGFAHYAMVANISYLHAGVNLYNNGFSAGFVAAIMVPIFDLFIDIWRFKDES